MNPILWFFAFIFSLGLLALTVITIIGLVFVTQFAFDGNNDGMTRSIELDDWQYDFVKVLAVYSWIAIGFGVLGMIIQLSRR